MASLIDAPQDAAIRVMELGCASGMTLSYIKSQYPNAETWGIELDEKAAKAAESQVDHCFCGNCEDMDLPGGEESFDYILCPDVLEHLRDPWKMTKRLAAKLKPGGCLICSIPNVTHWSVLIPYLRGRWDYQDAGILDRTHLHFFTFETAAALCEPEGMKREACMVTQIAISEEDQKFLDQLSALPQIMEPARMNAYQYLIRSRKKVSDRS